ncbi:YlbF family regulator [Caldinitratiruptor microaerophilus]|uniref:Cell fate regulator YlbF, YheA/YmcA/DUF963 family (Controls sporulation, competence, biofilm development) n=1 Tax=Caldinitratiruptor microaerophilus TaxID=671077 RepID=A0AA35G5T2_9FIRM|nr:YlbF family regulator [Caldinitratiruptor microaerophilus]BDG60076.1 hypothetical protein caldi_11660 [Caldinitratiruptor microaerophilus]
MGYIHELAHKLAKALQASPENQTFQEARRRVKADSRAEKQLLALRSKQWELAALQAQGKTPDAEHLKALQELAAAVQANPVAREYVEAEAQLTQLWSEINRILAEALGLPVAAQGSGPGR